MYRNHLFSVEAILGKRYNPHRQSYEYRIKWLGYQDRRATWEPIGNLAFIEESVKEFQQKGQIEVKYEEQDEDASNSCDELRTRRRRKKGERDEDYQPEVQNKEKIIKSKQQIKKQERANFKKEEIRKRRLKTKTEEINLKKKQTSIQNLETIKKEEEKT